MKDKLSCNGFFHVGKHYRLTVYISRPIVYEKDKAQRKFKKTVIYHKLRSF